MHFSAVWGRVEEREKYKRITGCLVYRWDPCHRVLNQNSMRLGRLLGFVEKGMLSWANLSIEICDLEEGFKGLPIFNQYRRVRQAFVPTRWWCVWF